MGLSTRVALTMLALHAVFSAAAQSTMRNADFEDGAAGDNPPGWTVTTPSYKSEATNDSPKHGTRCAKMTPTGEKDEHGFGNLLQGVGAAEWRGKRIRFRAAVRVSGGEKHGHAQLWFRVDRPEGKHGLFDNMSDRPILGSDWSYYDIVGDVHGDATDLVFGLMVFKGATAWIDDVSLESLGETVATPAEPPRSLTPRGLENLIAFTRVLGYVRYFHPSDEAAATNWEAFAVFGARAVESAKSADELAAKLTALFNPIAPTAAVFTTGSSPPAESPREKTDKITYWRHNGVGVEANNPMYRSWRSTADADDMSDLHPSADAPFTADLPGGVTLRLPLAVYKDDIGTLPRGARAAAPASAPTTFSADDRGTRLATVALAWNVFQHFYPYFDQVETDWPAALRGALTTAATDADECAFLATLRRMVAKLHDGHGNVTHGCENTWAYLPFLWGWIEDRLVITYVDPASDLSKSVQLKAGDIVTRVDGESSAEAISAAEELISGSPQWRRYRALNELRRGAANSEAALIVDASSGTRELRVKRVAMSTPLQPPQPKQIEEIRPGIWYVDIDRIDDDAFKLALPDLEKARGIIFDYRAYPSHLAYPDMIVIGHLIEKSCKHPRYHVPQITRPDRDALKYPPLTFSMRVEPRSPRLTGKAVFITNASAISQAECYLGIIEHYKLGPIIGSPSAGTNGNINPFNLPGGYRVWWTGLRVEKPDGSKHHGVGIVPTHPVARTIKGVSEGRDELLDAAILEASR